MSKCRCPLSKGCPFSDECKDHSWLCFWTIWMVLIGSVGFVVFVFVTGGLS